MPKQHQNGVVGNQNSLQNRGLFIVIEATYATTEVSQTELLKQKLERRGYEVDLYEFPELSEPSSYFVRQYLDGNYGGDVDPYTGSMMFSLERYQAGLSIKDALKAGKIVIATGYTASTMANFGTQFEYPEMRRGYFLWLENLEYQTFGIPRPDKSIVLRNNKADSGQYLESYDDICKLFPKDFDRLDCVRSNVQMSGEDIGNHIWQTINPMLPSRKIGQSTKTNSNSGIYSLYTQKFTSLRDSKGKYKYFVPQTLDDKHKIIYKTYLNTILDCYDVVISKLTSTIGSQINAFNIAQNLLPVACFSTTLTNKSTDKLLLKAINKHLDDTYLPVTNQSMRLISCDPRNELDILPEILFENSSTSIDEITKQTQKWTYNRKSKVLTSYLSSKGELNALNSVNYWWTYEGTFATLKDLKQLGLNVVAQGLTPQYGYEIPDIIEDNDISKMYELCFDLSLELNSKLVEGGYEHEAQYATLLGHRTRSYVTHTAQAIKTLQEVVKRDDISDDTKNVTNEMLTKISQNHSLISEP